MLAEEAPVVVLVAVAVAVVLVLVWPDWCDMRDREPVSAAAAPILQLAWASLDACLRLIAGPLVAVEVAAAEVEFFFPFVAALVSRGDAGRSLGVFAEGLEVEVGAGDVLFSVNSSSSISVETKEYHRL